MLKICPLHVCHTAPPEPQSRDWQEIHFFCVSLGLTSGESEHAFSMAIHFPYSNHTLLLHFNSLNMAKLLVKSDHNFHLTHIEFTLVATETIQYTGEYSQTDCRTSFGGPEHPFSPLTLTKLSSSKGRGGGRQQSQDWVLHGSSVTEPFSFYFLSHLQNMRLLYSEKKIPDIYTGWQHPTRF